MPDDPEARTQLARLLGNGSLRSASAEELRTLIEARFTLLVDGLLTETLASDDVFDRDSALEFTRQRLEFFESLIDAGVRTRLLDALREKFEAW